MKPEIYSFIIAIKIARQIWFRHGWMIAMISKVSDSINRLECALMKCGVSARDHFPKWFWCSSEGFRRNNHWFHIPKTWWTLIRNDRPKLALYQSCVPLASQFHQNVVVWMAIGNYYLKKEWLPELVLSNFVQFRSRMTFQTGFQKQFNENPEC